MILKKKKLKMYNMSISKSEKQYEEHEKTHKE